MRRAQRLEDPSVTFLAYHRAEQSSEPESRDVLVFDRDRGAWKSQSADVFLGKNFEPLYASTLEKILSSDLAGIPQKSLAFWVESFNAAATLARFKHKEIAPIAKDAECAKFSSVHKKYAWLSNFFPSLIYDPKEAIIYPTLESGYVAFKARKCDSAPAEVLHLAHMQDPKAAKQAGAGLWQRDSESDDLVAIEEMRRLVRLKFEQNPILAGWLKISSASLEEFTSDYFWGSGMGAFTGEDSNHLGQIIMQVREEFGQSVS